MTSKSKKTLIIATAVILALVLIGFTVSLVARPSWHEWSLGFARQMSPADREKVREAVTTANVDGVLDVYVDNANSSGTPFGHTVSVDVLADESKVKATDTKAIQMLVQEITDAVRATGVKDTYRLTVGLNVNNSTVSGTGTPEMPVTSAQAMFGADIVHDQSFVVE